MDSPLDVEITARRLDELMRWHGTDESNLPPAHTLQNLSRDTVAALKELQRSREGIERLRAAMGRAFWAEDSSELHAILLGALGPPPMAPGDWQVDDAPGPGLAASPPHDCAATWTPS